MRVELCFDRPGYIGEPYWPEMYHLIEIQKKSGMNRMRSERKIDQALANELQSRGMTRREYAELELLARRPFHTDDDGTIIIPAESIAACLVNGCYEATAKIKICDPKEVRSLVRCTDFRTGKRAADGIWERFAVVKDAKGKLSNQRGFRSSRYIHEFVAPGELVFAENDVQAAKMLAFLAWCGKHIGIGCSRKMGWGRFTVAECGDD